jgi:hypothetical protein
LADSVDALPDDVRGYKAVHSIAEALIGCLRGTPR